MNDQKKINLGILGCSNIALQKVIPAITHLENTHIAAISSRDSKKAQTSAATFNIPSWYDSYERLLADKSIHAVYISLPNNLHSYWVKASAEAGKHVLCEKPAALSEPEAEEMVTVCNKNNVLLLEGFMYKFHPQYKWIFETINNGTIGDIRIVHASFCYMLQPRHSKIRLQKSLGGGALSDTGCYCLNLIRWILEAEPERVNICAVKQSGFEVESTLCAVLEFPAERIATITCGFQSARINTCTIIGTKGRIELEHAFVPTGITHVSVFNEEELIERKQFPKTNLFTSQFKNFSDCILGENIHEVKAEDIIGNASALEMVRKSME